MSRTRTKNFEYMNKYRFGQKVQKMKMKRIICEICDCEPAATLHHKDENQTNNRNENLMPVCRPCHLELKHSLEIRDGYDASSRNGVLKPLSKVLQPSKSKRTSLKCYNTNNSFRKGNITLVITGTYKLRNLVESWGYKQVEMIA